MRFHQHIGLLLIFIHRRLGGDWCAKCAKDGFFEAFFVTLAFGWWGLISFFATLFFLPFNLVSHLLVQRSYASPTPTSESSRVAFSALAGGALLMSCMCTGPYFVLSAASSALSGLSGGYSGAAGGYGPPPMASAPTGPCTGERREGAPPYQPDSPRAVAYRSAEGGWVFDDALLPAAWRAPDDEAQFAVCVEPEETVVLERCAVSGGEIRRTAYPRVARLVELGTGIEIRRVTVESPEGPAPCAPDDALPRGRDHVVRSGARVQPGDVAAALEASPL